MWGWGRLGQVCCINNSASPALPRVLVFGINGSNAHVHVYAWGSESRVPPLKGSAIAGVSYSTIINSLTPLSRTIYVGDIAYIIDTLEYLILYTVCIHASTSSTVGSARMPPISPMLTRLRKHAWNHNNTRSEKSNISRGPKFYIPTLALKLGR